MHKKKENPKNKLKANFANIKSRSFSAFEAKSPGQLKPYKKKEEDIDGIKELIKTKNFKKESKNPSIPTINRSQELTKTNTLMENGNTLPISNQESPSIGKNFFLLDENSGNNINLPNQVPTPQKMEKLEKLQPKIIDHEDYPVSSPLKKKPSLRVIIDDMKRVDSDLNEKKKFPQSATLPITRNISGLIDQIRKQSNQDLTSPNHGKIKENDSNLNPNCLVCFDKPPNAVFMNCGHGGNIFKFEKYIYIYI